MVILLKGWHGGSWAGKTVVTSVLCYSPLLLTVDVLVPSGSSQQADPHKIRCTTGNRALILFSIDKRWYVQGYVCPFYILACGEIDGRAFNQEVYRRFLIIGGSGYLSTSPEVLWSPFRAAFAVKSGNRKDNSEALVKESALSLQQQQHICVVNDVIFGRTKCWEVLGNCQRKAYVPVRIWSATHLSGRQTSTTSRLCMEALSCPPLPTACSQPSCRSTSLTNRSQFPYTIPTHYRRC